LWRIVALWLIGAPCGWCGASATSSLEGAPSSRKRRRPEAASCWLTRRLIIAVACGYERVHSATRSGASIASRTHAAIVDGRSSRSLLHRPMRSKSGLEIAAAGSPPPDGGLIVSRASRGESSARERDAKDPSCGRRCVLLPGPASPSRAPPRSGRRRHASHSNFTKKKKRGCCCHRISANEVC
jgi:hypothetical protein